MSCKPLAPLVAVGALVIATACSPDPQSPTAPTERNSQTPDSSIASLANPDVPIFNVDAASTSPDGRGPCVFDVSTGQFTCPPETRHGITFTRRFTVYDARGNVQSRFDPVTTASIMVETTASGTTTRGGAAVTIDRRGVMTTSGLEGDETTHILNGNESGTVTSTRTEGGVVITIKTTIDDRTANLVLPRRADRQRGYPLSGTKVHATAETTIRGSETRTKTVRRQETFDGTNIVQVELTINGVTERCTYDLTARTTTCSTR